MKKAFMHETNTGKLHFTNRQQSHIRMLVPFSNRISQLSYGFMRNGYNDNTCAN